MFSEIFEDVSFTKALEKWLSLTNEQESPLDGTQKNWTQPVFVKTAQDLISRMDYKRSKVFNAHQGKFGSHWLNVVPCKNLGLKLDDQQLRISIGLRLGANICFGHTCHCGKRVEREILHGLFCGYMTFRPIHFQPMHFQPLPFHPRTISTYCIFNRPQFRPISFGYLVIIRLSY